MKIEDLQSTADALPRVSSAAVKLFAAYSNGYVGRRFHSFRILKNALPPRDCPHPLVIYLNHAAWWDPLVCLLLAREFLPHRTSFAPIASQMLTRYRFFSRLGFFGIESRSARGARTFLRTAHGILGSSSHALWLTPQGRFMDVRERPLRFEDGLGVLATREPDAAFVPLAIEYAFWTEPCPEILVAFGEPVRPRDADPSLAGWTRTFSEALTSTQDALATHSCRRDPGDWTTLSRGKTGIGFIYDAWRRLCARLRGEAYIAEHSPHNAP